jgi:hypothetical protein
MPPLFGFDDGGVRRRRFSIKKRHTREGQKEEPKYVQDLVCAKMWREDRTKVFGHILESPIAFLPPYSKIVPPHT